MSDALEVLLQVQEHDTTVDQLRHRRATLPARAELAEVEAATARLEARAAEARGRRGELADRQAALEAQIEQSRRRREEIERRLYQGQAAARDLQVMDDEMRQLARHITELEDRELELMEAIEPLDGELQAAEVERDALDARARALRADIASTEAELDAEIGQAAGERDALAAAVPSELLSRYERLRAKLGGTGAARLAGNACTGCHLTLPAMEVDRIRRAPPDEVITCEQCGRILVR